MFVKPVFVAVGLLLVSSHADAAFRVRDVRYMGCSGTEDIRPDLNNESATISVRFDDFSVYASGSDDYEYKQCMVLFELEHSCGCLEVEQATWSGFRRISREGEGFVAVNYYLNADLGDYVERTLKGNGAFVMQSRSFVSDSMSGRRPAVLKADAMLDAVGPKARINMASTNVDLEWKVRCCERGSRE